MKRLAALCLLTAGCATAPLSGEAARTIDVIDSNMAGWLEDYNVPAAAVAVIEDGQVVYAKAFGERVAGEPIRQDTLFNVASMMKPVAAETLLRLALNGDVDLDESMAVYWRDPDIADNPWTDLLTPKLALTHRSGFPNWRYQTEGKLTFTAKPGTSAGYSGEGYEYTARFAEKKTGTPFDELVDVQVIKPLRLKNTLVGDLDGREKDVTPPHGESGEALELQISIPWSAADDLHTTAKDYGRFMAAVSRGDGVGDDAHQLRLTPSIDQFADGCPLPQPACPTSGGFSVGWAVFDYAEGRMVFQGGGDAGIRTMAFFNAETLDGMVILTNSDNGGKIIARSAEAMSAPSGFQAFLRLQAGEAP